MKLRRLLVGSVLLGLIASPGCADDDDDSNSVSEEQAAEFAAAFLCDAYFECNCDDWDSGFTFSSPDQCRAEIEATAQLAIDEGKESGLTYDSTCVPKLRDAVDAMACSLDQQFIYGDGWIELVEATECKLYRGEGAEGDACTELVHSGGDDCDEGLRCYDGACILWGEANKATEGQACQFPNDCVAGTFCIDVEGNDEPTCESLPDAGQTCLGVNDYCEIDGYCDQTSKDCAPLPGPGETCLDTPSWAGMVCERFSVCGSGGFCEAAPKEGEDCDPGDAPESWVCELGTTCLPDTGTCEAQQPLACDMYWEFQD